jgi:hypothetical protein
VRSFRIKSQIFYHYWSADNNENILGALLFGFPILDFGQLFSSFRFFRPAHVRFVPSSFLDFLLVVFLFPLLFCLPVLDLENLFNSFGVLASGFFRGFTLRFVTPQFFFI